MKEKRKTERKAADIDIEFNVTEVQFRQSTNISSKGKIIDISDDGFGLITHYPLQKGQVIRLESDGHDGLPKFGLAQWTSHESGVCRAGLGFKFNKSF
ncbi:MAG: PilZ domain-containing protein [Nitrospirae bacterium]|nr:PilZ domain-containing protein [Nitrospirota bacterium]